MKSGAPFSATIIALIVLAGCTSEARWFKGNLHTHSYWSDGDDFPEMIVAWYQDNGYDFVALSDHNVIAEGDRWISVTNTPGVKTTLGRYVEHFGSDWVEQRVEAGDTLVRLKTFAEYREMFVGPTFLTLQSEEISDYFERKPIHVNATNIRQVIEPQGGGSVVEVMQNNIDAVLSQREETNQPMFPHVNHPNYRWAITAAELASVRGEKFFEVYNGHHLVMNDGDSTHAGTERIWDLVVTSRLLTGHPVMFGLAVDDAHNYHDLDRDRANPGRGWIMVRANALTADALIGAMEEGEFYASTGVVLEDISVNDDEIRIRIAAEPGLEYTTHFIGTRRASFGDAIYASPADFIATRGEDSVIGEVLAVIEGSQVVYRMDGTELYVRARVTSTRLMANPVNEGEYERAWTQPVVPE